MIQEIQHNNRNNQRNQLKSIIRKCEVDVEEVQDKTGIYSELLKEYLEEKVDLDEYLENVLSEYIDQKEQLLRPLEKKNANFQQITHDNFIKRNLDNYLRFFKGSEIVETGDQCKFRNIIPIRVDIEFEQKRYKDNILWNLDDQSMTEEQFARLVCEDNGLNQLFEHEIINIIKRQIQNYKPYLNNLEENIQTIEIDVRLDNVNFRDKFEWDISDPKNDPIEFTDLLCEEMGLDNEFKVQIAFEIFEHIYTFHRCIWQRQETIDNMEDIPNIKRSLKYLKESQTNGQYGVIRDSNTVYPDSYFRPITQIYNDQTDNLQSFEPQIEYLDDQDIRKVQRLENRKYRYERRNR